MTAYTVRPHDWWPDTHVEIYRDGDPVMGCPKDRVDESIAYLKESSRSHFQSLVDRRASSDPSLVIAAGHAYTVGSEDDYPKGFGGASWRIVFHDGRRVITTSLWHNGDIPVEWRNQLPDNAWLGVLR